MAETTGTPGDDILIGDADANGLEGGLGNDGLDGAGGVDTAFYWQATSGVTVNLATGTASGGEGNDTLKSIENVVGSDFADTLSGDANDNYLSGGAGNDVLTGGDGNDALEGGDGADTMSGGKGDDFYKTDGLDTFTEAPGEGTDTLESAVSVVLPNNIELLYLTGSAPANATGNAGNNTFRGNSSNNVINGGDGVDTVDYSQAGNPLGIGVIVKLAATTELDRNTLTGGTDTLISIENVIGSVYRDSLYGDASSNVLTGLAGNDYLDGGAGADTLTGGIGDDTYVYDPLDTIVELANEGSDTVLSSVSYVLSGNNLENVRLAAGTTNINATGSALNNALRGNAGNNIFTGGAGNDSLDGDAGVDTAAFSLSRTNYTLTKTVSGFSIAAKSGSDGTDSLVNVERVKYSDVNIAIDFDGNAAITAKILGAVFGQASVQNKEYFGIGLGYLDNGMEYVDLMQLALTAAGANTNAKVVDLIWTNLFGSGPTPEQAKPYVDLLDQNGETAKALLKAAADLDLNTTNINLVGLQQTGIEYIPFVL